ncbi:AAA family ATPase [Nocardiopsis sp. MT53]|uniref:AAA family ATPase n=1 Tax=Nocardiopsis sp. MT53 TaxID=2865672 RepID=UPI00351CBDAA
MRHGEPARHLSEGEKTAIALLCFLQSLEERGRELSSTVVVVDDPVSSLADELTYGVYSTLTTRLDPEEGSAVSSSPSPTARRSCVTGARTSSTRTPPAPCT